MLKKQYSQNMLESLDKKMNLLLPKKKKELFILPLHDPVNKELFDVYGFNAGSQSKYKQDLKCSQLTIASTILLYTGLRVNEIRS
jgi:hypothetical protein